MDGSSDFPVTDPGAWLIGAGALCGLLAAKFLFDVARSIDTKSAITQGPDKEAVGIASMFTGLAVGLASLGYLLKLFIG